MSLDTNEEINHDEDKTIDLASVALEINKDFTNMVANMDETVDLKDIKDKINNEISK